MKLFGSVATKAMSCLLLLESTNARQTKASKSKSVEPQSQQAAPLSDVEFCVGALLGSQFEITNTADFSKWFDDKSVMQFAQAGVYLGLDGIQEYVNFAYTPWLWQNLKIVSIPDDKGTNGSSTIPNLSTIARDGNKCDVTVAIKTCRDYNQENVKEGYVSADVLVGYRLIFDVVDFSSPPSASILVERANIYYSDDYIVEVFANALLTDALFQKNCEIMRESCGSTWEQNFASTSTIEDCVDKLKDLAATETSNGIEGYIDGNSSGCRTLHAGFAFDNQNHCAHISFEKQEDPNGKIKCQEVSDRVTPLDLFGTDNIAFFNFVAINYYEIPDGFVFRMGDDGRTCQQLYQ